MYIKSKLNTVKNENYSQVYMYIFDIIIINADKDA